MTREELVEELDRTLKIASFPDDPSNNGLQIEGAPEVKRILFGVDASLALFEYAAANQFDFVFVHHGISWGGEPRRFTGIHAKRFRILFRSGISLYGAHLPLDAHPTLGNNARLAELAGLSRVEPFCNYHGCNIGLLGCTKTFLKAAELTDKLGTELKTKPRLIADEGRALKRIAVVSGNGGMDALEQAASAGADLLITGEFQHEMFHPACELPMPTLALGHYATETLGPKAVMEYIERKFDLFCAFADFPTSL